MRREEGSLLVTHARCTAYPLSRRTDVDGRLVCARRSPQPAVVQQQQLCWWIRCTRRQRHPGPMVLFFLFLFKFKWPVCVAKRRTDGHQEERRPCPRSAARTSAIPHVRPDTLSSLSDSRPFLLKRKEKKEKFYLFRDWADYPSSAHVSREIGSSPRMCVGDGAWESEALCSFPDDLHTGDWTGSTAPFSFWRIVAHYDGLRGGPVYTHTHLGRPIRSAHFFIDRNEWDSPRNWPAV